MISFLCCVWSVLLLSLGSCAPALRVTPPYRLEAWVVYFDAQSGLDELQDNGALFDRVSLFAYELDPQGRPVPAPHMDEMIGPFLKLAGQHGFEPWVTVVNDVRYSSDKTVLKDADVVHIQIAGRESRAAHARMLAERVAADGFGGLHLDYERIPESDTRHFQEFVKELDAELKRRGLGLEVVVEPISGPLPVENSASVTVMGYNLHGPHSPPGPRATPDFLAGLAPRANVDFDNTPTLAIAVGGFLWKPDGEVEPVVWVECRKLASSSEKLNRDKKSHVPYARLENGAELWFDDPESVLRKWQAAGPAGFRNIIIWRLGGNDVWLFDLLENLRKPQFLNYVR